ncbi:hypothetical protein CANARDRAFT_5464 [[Candida] arabinofermentans NRRL YB-2248]|uniref:Phosphoglycerate mutase n=1 Tax=[Candida] arabinofermentans NRRL YB-2248 TaxID=983967 RepID=A0A1E4T8S7_9ASCO|nr:hypothetical protein CANARDRAFT_5464 [[Candida] arabinofermentans NRRL YB-2248]
MVGTIILIRHGQSLWNKSNLFCGWVDIELSDKGKQQAIDSANLIKASGISPPDVCFTSRLTRAVQTANIVLEQLENQYIDVTKSWRLNERHYGKLQGLSKNAVLDEYGEEKYMYWRRAYNGCPPLVTPEDKYYCIDDKHRYQEALESELPRGESLKMVMDRLLPFYHETIVPELQKGKTVLIVSHGSVVRALAKFLYEIDEEAIAKINIPNGIPLVIKMTDELTPIGKEIEYLAPERAKIEAEKVARQGFEHK